MSDIITYGFRFAREFVQRKGHILSFEFNFYCIAKIPQPVSPVTFNLSDSRQFVLVRMSIYFINFTFLICYMSISTKSDNLAYF